ncbi:MAG: sugar phosphate isomerase/epimerase [Deltaproteobacteria bacterium]|nr:sugar phosphate isomerase/epimerase [Deltaproteobacteria bacterium]
MIGISTAWRAMGATSGEGLLTAMDESGVDALELEYRISSPVFNQLVPLLKTSRRPIVSLHNFCPTPPDIPPDKASGDLFSLADLDRDIRKEAVKWTTRTLEKANDLGVEVVVLHLGQVDMDTNLPEVRTAFFKKEITIEEARLRVAEPVPERRAKAPKHLDALLSSLDRLVNAAVGLHVHLGLENRNHLRNLPTYEELDLILKTFDGAPLGYWHDVGHAQVGELLGGPSQRETLEKYKGRTLGLHLHDTQGFRDHLAPGCGDVNFEELAEHLKDIPRRVMEVSRRVTAEEVRRGVQLLQRIGL